MNTPLQGTAADLIKLAMIRIDERLGSEGPQARMLVQIHDELLLEVPSPETKAVEALVVKEMTGAIGLDAPIVVATGWGRNWAQAHGCSRCGLDFPSHLGWDARPEQRRTRQCIGVRRGVPTNRWR
ncbi:MAG: DNA polymerase [Planctomycetota bacterium]